MAVNFELAVKISERRPGEDLPARQKVGLKVRAIIVITVLVAAALLRYGILRSSSVISARVVFKGMSRRAIWLCR